MANNSEKVKKRFKEGLNNLSKGERRLLITYLAVSVGALALGGIFALFLALEEAGFISLGALTAYKFLTLHGATSFYYWLYLAQVGVMLALILVFIKGARLTPVWLVVSWIALLLIIGGWVLDLVSPLMGAVVTYKALQPLTGETSSASEFLLGYILLSIGLLVSAVVGIVTAIRPKLEGHIKEWSAIGYGAFLWQLLLFVAAIISLYAYVPALQMISGAEPFIPNFSYSSSWSVMFHNMHYLPLLSTVLVWYALVEATTGVKSIFSDRLSKAVFSLYLIFVPPTALYHMFLEPNISGGVKLIGSLLSLFIIIPTLAVFLILVISLQACANGKGAHGVFGWLRYLPWRNPIFACVAMAVVSSFGGGVIANVMLQERFASLLSDTYTLPGYFHFLTVGTVTLTFIGALLYIVPILRRHRLPMPSLAAVLPYVMTIGVYIFGVAGIWGGYLGLPRQTPGLDYAGAAPGSWDTLLTIIGIGAVIMVAAGAAYVFILLVALVRDAPSGKAVDELPYTSFHISDSVGQKIWFGPVAVGTLLLAMYVATTLAYRVMNNLPIIG